MFWSVRSAVRGQLRGKARAPTKTDSGVRVSSLHALEEEHVLVKRGEENGEPGRGGVSLAAVGAPNGKAHNNGVG